MEQIHYQRILAPVDGSKVTARVVDHATAVAKRNHAHLDLLNVVQINQINDGYAKAQSISGDQAYNLVTLTEARLNDLKRRAKKNGLDDVSIHVRFGNPKRVIARDFLRDHHNDLIVIGATGLSSVERMLGGSVTPYVVRNAPCDVIVTH
ncbi:universal stress protein [Limosilactobacillus difficilis]|uniref:universal stress protein n=1 Tax=Limosilactobacillus difficilis TaxID=2991838 RepID=UPI0024BA2E7D|nr:universal stress protein [Limosilactobacillus difficilis]